MPPDTSTATEPIVGAGAASAPTPAMVALQRGLPVPTERAMALKFPALLGRHRHDRLVSMVPDPDMLDEELAARLEDYNVAVAAVVTRTVTIIEVPLRNAVDISLRSASIAAHRSNTEMQPKEWWKDVRVLREDPDFYSRADERTDEHVEGALKKADEAAKRAGRAVVRGDVVAQFTLGFWVRLFSRQRTWARIYPQLSGIKAGVGPWAEQSYMTTQVRMHRASEEVLLLRNRSAHQQIVMDLAYDTLTERFAVMAAALGSGIYERVVATWHRPDPAEFGLEPVTLGRNGRYMQFRNAT